LPSKEKVSKVDEVNDEMFRDLAGHRRITSKGQVTIPNVMRKRYNITPRTKLEFVPRAEGIMVRPVREEGSFGELAGSASKHWTLNEMLRRLEELRKEHV